MSKPAQFAPAILDEAQPAWAALQHELDELTATRRRTPCSVDPNPFTSDDPDERAEATAACAACPVLIECAAFAYANHETAAVWAGVDLTGSPGRRPRKRLERLLEVA